MNLSDNNNNRYYHPWAPVSRIMADESFTPQRVTLGILENNADQVNQTAHATRHQTQAMNVSQSRAQSAQKPENRKRRNSYPDLRSTAKKGKVTISRMSASYSKKITPRTLITGFLGSQDSEKTLRVDPRLVHTPHVPSSPGTQRKSRHKSLLREAATRRLQRSMPDLEEGPTPRTLINGFVHYGDEETPVLPIQQSHQRASVHQAYDSNIIERSQVQNTSKLNKTTASGLEDSFMRAYNEFSQPAQEGQTSRMQTRYQRKHLPLPRKSTKNLSSRSLLGNTGTNETAIRSRQVTEIVTTALVHATISETNSDAETLGEEKEQEPSEEPSNLEEQEKDDQDEGEKEDQKEVHIDEEGELGNIKEANQEEKWEEEEPASDLDMSEDYTTTKIVSLYGSQAEQTPTPQEEELYENGAEFEADVRQYKEIIPESEEVVGEGLEEQVNGPGKRDLSIVLPSEVSEDEIDSHRGLPGFNKTFTENITRNRFVQMRSPLDRTEPRHPHRTMPKPKAHAPSGRNVSKPKKSTFPRLPAVNTASIFRHFTNLRVSKDAMFEVENAADAFWEQVFQDLSMYANHGGRTSVDESDMALLMRRQHVTSEHLSMYTLVEKYLPLEYQMEVIDVAKSGNVIVP